MSTFQTKFMSLPPEERERIATEAGLTLGYLTKHMYSSGGDPKFHLHNAVALDKASNGLFPLTETTRGDVDWKYVFARLAFHHYQGSL